MRQNLDKHKFRSNSNILLVSTKFKYNKIKYIKNIYVYYFFLLQSIAMAIQQGNEVCVMGCPKEQSTGLEGLFNFQVHEAEEL